MDQNTLLQQLFALADAGYREFHCKLIPDYDPNRVIGIRTPVLRKFAASFAKDPASEQFLDTLPHFYYEENNLHGMLLERKKDYEEVIRRLEVFLPQVDNWATCDLLSPKVFAKHHPELWEQIPQWLADAHPYTVRFGLGMLMSHFLEEDFTPQVLQRAGSIRREEYYVKMMQAWLFATALAKQWDATLPWLTEHRLDVWVHNKSIQKAVESRRITPEQKELLRGLKRK
ncbi:MAG TPA: DNA alkylation repair protein [Candidatus Egerieicola pullicola]|uniref:DNA alkylation repair protein n=1 Tax=Candidatus Egerieicola pullicola TaxID=2840775 RepID=A0A9D1DBJ5_9FIRM|nr:DNA alkylation repair protein [Candidatus Egerieicola pullicola]